MRFFITFLGSIYFAVALLASLVIILITSTLVESAHGTPLVQRFFYQAGWFDVFLSLIALNMFTSMMLRVPFKKHHTGFVITHIGALVLLAGSLLSRLFGVEGQMMLFESEKSDAITQSEYEITLHRHSGGLLRFDLADLPGRSDRSLDGIAQGLSMRVLRVLENAREAREIEEGAAEDGPNAAVQIRLKSATAGFDESFWLVEKDSQDAHSRFKSMGPASFELRRSVTAAGAKPGVPSVRLIWEDQPPLEVPLDTSASARIPMGQTGYGVENFSYYPNARVDEKNRLVHSGDKAENPAVELDWVDPQGRQRREVFFAFFPEFGSMHGKTSPDGGPRLEVQFSLPEEGFGDILSAASGPRLVIETDGSRWSYRSSSKGGERGGAVRLGETIGTGWMDIELRVESLLDRARVRRSIRPAPGKGFLAAELSFRLDGKEIWRGWIPEEESIRPPVADDVTVRIGVKNRRLPFALTLEDFRKVDYPGTANAKSYESDVVLVDAEDRIQIHKTIKMNEPMDYKGYRIFQSSFLMDPAQGEASIFTIAKNPGIVLIYGGAVVLFVGVFMVFFIKPFSPWRNT